MSRRCVIYARISVASEESVSIERQIKSAEQYAAARDWEVVGAFKDEGVSATSNRPDVRPGWRALMASEEKFDAVIIWRLDRLARRVIDFHLANESLKERGAGLVAVENAIDMATPDGRMVAGVLAQFAEYEADLISARVAAARRHLIHARRVVGGTVSYGWKSIPNPDGPGLVLAQDPDRIAWVRAMVDRTLAGQSIYATARWLDDEQAPAPTGKGWSYSTVERLLRNPVLAGLTPYNPGNKTRVRGSEFLRDDDGLPVVDESVAIMSPAEWRAMVRALDERSSPQTMSKAERAKTSPLLSGLVLCGEHDGRPVRMHRGTVQGRAGYSCPTCGNTCTNFEDAVIQEFLLQKGERVRWTEVSVVREGGSALLPEIEQRLDELDTALRAANRTERQRLQVEQANLLDLRDQKRAEAPVTELVYEQAQTHGQDWAEATTLEQQRAILEDAIERIWVMRGKPGRRKAGAVLSRLRFDWKFPDDLGPIEPPDDATLASTAE